MILRASRSTLFPYTTLFRSLTPVIVAEESAGPSEAARLIKSDQLVAAGWDEQAHAELDDALKSQPTSPSLNLAKAKLYRARNDNVQAFNVLRRSFPDYSQMSVEELTRDEWDVFYPRSEEHTSELQSRQYLVCRLLLEKKK